MRCRVTSILACIGLLGQAYSQCGDCENDQPVATAPHKNIWLELSDQELESVTTYLTGRLNLTTLDEEEPTTRVNTIFEVELLHPNKTDVLPWLAGGYSAEPKRYARATVSFGVPDDAYFQEYMVGPLPASNVTKLQSLTYPFNSDNPGKTRIPPLTLPGQNIAGFIEKFGIEIEDISLALWNTTIADEGVTLRSQFPLVEDDDGKFLAWAEFVGVPTSEFDSTTLLPLGVSVQLDTTDRDVENWAVTGWFCMGQFYSSTEEFHDAVFSGSFEKPAPNVDGNWTSMDRQGERLPLDELPPPAPVSPGSQRFALDVEEKYVTWMDFSFYMSTTKTAGLSLFDIRYKGKRIIYELALQEALAQYAGADPVLAQSSFFDVLDGMGSRMVTLVNGYDCPNYATYLNSTVTILGVSTEIPNSICMFEYDTGYPIRRHLHAAGSTSSAKNIVFSVRTISTVGNYDYLIEYSFFLDGGVEISVRASGYISSAYYAGNEDYGFKIHDFLSGDMHDHVLTFKADLDILGEENSVQKVEFVPDTIEYPWAPGKPRNTFRAAKSFVTSESEASIDWAANDAAMYAIVNKDAPNKFGEFPGYRVRRAAGTSHLTAIDGSNTGNAAHYAAHDLYFTKRKDTEPRAADPYNPHDIWSPLVDFDKFLDGESLEQEDLVLWFNLGMHHIPHTGDLPNTLMTSAHSAIRLEPLNYLPGDASVATAQQVRVVHETGEVKTFGASGATCSVDMGALEVGAITDKGP